MTQKSVLIIGGAGYVGSSLTRELLAQGHEVTVLDALLYDNAAAMVGVFEDPSFSFVRGDFTDAKTLSSALAGKTDVVLLAALVGDPICKKYPDDALAINQHAPMALIDRLDEFGVKRFVFASTCSNYGLRASEDLATEDAELNPVSLYAQTKVAVERYIFERFRSLSAIPTVVRLATAHGLSPRMRFDLTVAEFARELALGRDLLVYDQDTWRPYCHVRDISTAIRTVLDAEPEAVRGEVFNIGGTDENFTKRGIVEIIAKTLGGPANVTYKEGGHDPRNYRVSFEKAAKVLGFRPEFGVSRSVPDVVAAVKSGAFDDYDLRKNFYGNYAIRRDA
jgi:nucleoside-diphosphate-sugar epimerase